jgi:hypothetical protein
MSQWRNKCPSADNFILSPTWTQHVGSRWYTPDHYQATVCHLAGLKFVSSDSRYPDLSVFPAFQPYSVISICSNSEVPGWQTICYRPRREASPPLLATDIWNRFMLYRINRVGQTFNGQLWLTWSLLCSMCYTYRCQRVRYRPRAVSKTGLTSHTISFIKSVTSAWTQLLLLGNFQGERCNWPTSLMRFQERVVYWHK